MPAPTIKSRDELQQRLRDKKREWNASYKDFSQKLKGFKDGLNGRGNAKIGLPPSNIKDPLPNEIGALLHQLAGEFQAVVNNAEGIIVEQTSYSQHRKKKQQNTLQPIQNGNPLAGLASSEFEIAKIASNKLTRFWQYVSSYFSSKKFNKQRIGLLSQSADLYYNLLDFENDILTLDIKAIPNAISKYESFKSTFATFSNSFDSIVRMVAESENIEIPKEEKQQEQKSENNEIPDAEIDEENNQPSPKPAVPATPSTHRLNLKSDNDLDKIRHDIHLLFNANLAKTHITAFNELFQDYDEEADEFVKEMFADQIKERYESLLYSLISEVKTKYNLTNINTIEDVISAIKKNSVAESVADYMIKQAHNAISRNLKRQLIKSMPYNKTAASRLEVIEFIDEMKLNIKKMMDTIEGVNITNSESIVGIKNQIKSIEILLDKIRYPMHTLNLFFAKDFYSSNENLKPNKNISEKEKIVDYVMKKRLRKQLSEDLL